MDTDRNTTFFMAFVFVFACMCYVETCNIQAAMYNCPGLDNITLPLQLYTSVDERNRACGPVQESLNCVFNDRYAAGCRQAVLYRYEAHLSVISNFCVPGTESALPCIQDLSPKIDDCLLNNFYNVRMMDKLCSAREEAYACIDGHLNNALNGTVCDRASLYLLEKMLLGYLKPFVFGDPNCEWMKEPRFKPTTIATTTTTTTTTTPTTTRKFKPTTSPPDTSRNGGGRVLPSFWISVLYIVFWFYVNCKDVCHD